ncbi:MAG TPA: tetratricopeptide repeat protein [Pseudolabrys sp.]|jgi:Flp pilus assembly protein TadD|nr:tetratricopeptide repeat protein [Pseudolabrys sp.]
MSLGIARPLIIAAAGLWLAGCTTSSSFSDLFGSKTPGADASASAQANETSSEPHLTVDGSAPVQAVEESTGSVAGPSGKKTAPGLLGSDPNDELSLGKKQYRANNYGLAEKHFRLAVEKHPRDAEAWLGLAASYDRLRRFDLADRAYSQAVGILGPTVEILNNQGYSYMLRGDYKRAHATLAAARRKDPNNKYVLNNLRLLEESYRKGKSIE